MKTQIHPQYFDARVVCACGNKFSVGSTKKKFTLSFATNAIHSILASKDLWTQLPEFRNSRISKGRSAIRSKESK